MAWCIYLVPRKDLLRSGGTRCWISPLSLRSRSRPSATKIDGRRSSDLSTGTLLSCLPLGFEAGDSDRGDCRLSERKGKEKFLSFRGKCEEEAFLFVKGSGGLTLCSPIASVAGFNVLVILS